MWAQLITTRLRPGKEDGLHALLDRLRNAEKPGSGLLRTTTMRDQKDPSRLYMIVLFESEEAARVRERDPNRQESLADTTALMAEIFEGAPEFVDLTVVEDFTY